MIEEVDRRGAARLDEEGAAAGAEEGDDDDDDDSIEWMFFSSCAKRGARACRADDRLQRATHCIILGRQMVVEADDGRGCRRHRAVMCSQLSSAVPLGHEVGLPVARNVDRMPTHHDRSPRLRSSRTGRRWLLFTGPRLHDARLREGPSARMALAGADRCTR